MPTNTTNFFLARRALALAFCLAPFCCDAQLALAQRSDAYAALVQEATKAYKEQRYVAFRDAMAQALKLRPKHPGLLYRLAVGQALTGEADKAFATLDLLADMGVAYAIDKNADFAALQKTERFAALQQRFDANSKPISKAAAAFSLPEQGFITEGLAFNPRNGDFFVSSVRKRAIFRVSPTGQTQEFSKRSDSLWGVFGMAFDAERQELWAATSALEQMEGFAPALKGKAGAARYDAKSGVLTKFCKAPTDGKERVLGDVALAPNGDVYLTNSLAPEIFVIRRKGDFAGDSLELFARHDDFVSLQGLCFDERGALFVADYARGVWRFAPGSRQAELLPYPDNAALLGIDGIYYHKSGVVAVQNGTNPNRVLRLRLNAEHSAITNVETLESNNPLFDDPALGVLVGDEFYWIANSQWGAYNDDGSPKPSYPLQKGLILKRKL